MAIMLLLQGSYLSSNLRQSTLVKFLKKCKFYLDIKK
nr:MAG TPA: protein of unknown function (DUF5581) [Bacteriophage sp.]